MGDDFAVKHFLERGRRFWSGAFPREGATILEWSISADGSDDCGVDGMDGDGMGWERPAMRSHGTESDGMG